MYRLKCSIDACSLLADSGRRSSEEMASLCSYDDKVEVCVRPVHYMRHVQNYSSVFMFFCAKSATQKIFIHEKMNGVLRLSFSATKVKISPYIFNRSSFFFLCCR